MANTNVGIGPGNTNPQRQTDVNGEINTATHYEIGDQVVVSIDGTGNVLLGVGPSSSGGENTIVGSIAGVNNTGSLNTFVGWEAGVNNTSGTQNTMLGAGAGLNSTGSYDTFVGYDTANGLTVGSKNIFLGFAAGNNNGGGDNDIYIGNPGCPGPAPCSESNTIRIGGVGSVGSYGPQTAAYIVGIYNSTATPTPPFQAVCVDLNGTLFGTTPGTNCATSSRRFKDHIADMVTAAASYSSCVP